MTKSWPKSMRLCRERLLSRDDLAYDHVDTLKSLPDLWGSLTAATLLHLQAVYEKSCWWRSYFHKHPELAEKFRVCHEHIARYGNLPPIPKDFPDAYPSKSFYHRITGPSGSLLYDNIISPGLPPGTIFSFPDGRWGAVLGSPSVLNPCLTGPGGRSYDVVLRAPAKGEEKSKSRLTYSFERDIAPHRVTFTAEEIDEYYRQARRSRRRNP